MSACSRGALLKAFGTSTVRPSSKVFGRLASATILRAHTARTGSTANSATRHALKPHRYFSTTCLQRHAAPENITDVLPVCCPGCGAFSQTVEPDEPGYYGASRKQTRKLLAQKNANDRKNATSEDAARQPVEDFNEATAPRPIAGNLPSNHISSNPVSLTTSQEGALPEDSIESSPNSLPLEAPDRGIHVCDRCHDLVHHNREFDTPKPDILAIRDYLKQSPYKYNRVYHIIDAADFPMSLVRHIHAALAVQEQRSLNRRASHEKYFHGKKLPTLSFIITRSDLLAATKNQVDSKMEYVRTELRKALGRAGKDVRLGNIHMISAHRGWWTKQVKEEIREHGGGIWVVGKANVGKSSFIQACFPKDMRNIEDMAQWIEEQGKRNEIPNQRLATLYDHDSLLPPAPREHQFPVLPVVSSMPGTTVSPIRIPFGRGKGEVIDLPGMERGELQDFVRDERKRDLMMTKRIKPERCTIKPGQSLLLGGGLVRITPVNPEHTVLAACFVPIETHLTKTEKAIEIQNGRRPYSGTVLMKEEACYTILSAGKIDLQWDVTRSNLPTSVVKAVEDHDAPIPQLPYQVMSADILIEGCGWIEISIQIRAKRNAEDNPTAFPQVEVFTPNGKHIGFRPPIESWNFIAEKLKADKRKRPRTRHRYSR